MIPADLRAQALDLLTTEQVHQQAWHALVRDLLATDSHDEQPADRPSEQMK